VIQPVTFFVDNRQQLRLLRRLLRRARKQIGHGSLNRRQRRAKIVRNRIQQRRFQTFALALCFGFAQLLNRPRPLNRNRHH